MTSNSTTKAMKNEEAKEDKNMANESTTKATQNEEATEGKDMANELTHATQNEDTRNTDTEKSSAKPSATDRDASVLPADTDTSTSTATGSEEKANEATDKKGTRRKKGDIEQLPPMTCEDYRHYMEGTYINPKKGKIEKPDKDTSLSRNPPPTDGIKLADLRHKSDDELLEIINEMAKEEKSDVRVMYVHGYAFTWTELATVANFKGFKPESNARNSKYIMEGATEQAPLSSNTLAANKYGFIEIEHGKFDGREIHWKITKETFQKFEELFEGLACDNLEYAKIRDAVICRGLDTMLALKREGRFAVAYAQPKAPQWIIPPSESAQDT